MSEVIIYNLGAIEYAAAPPSGIHYNRPIITGHDVSYDLYDEAWQLANGTYDYAPPSNPIHSAQLDSNAVSPFTTLVNQNEFGNLNRFTDENGLQVYGNNYAIDHYTGLGWDLTPSPFAFYAAHLTNAEAHSNALGMNDFRTPNQNEMQSVFNFGLLNDRDTLGYSPFNNPFTGFFMSCTTTPQNAGTSLNFNSPVQVYGYISQNRAKASVSCQTYYIRNHY